MSEFFFSGSVHAKLDDKNRFVLPQHLRYGLVEAGSLEFTLSLGLGGCLAIHKKSEMMKIVKKFQSKQHVVRYQKFFTLFFSTLHTTTCDNVGRVLLPAVLKKAVGINEEIVIAGVLSKIEIWPKAKYEYDLQSLLSGGENNDMTQLAEEAFSLLNDEPQRIPDEELALDDINTP
jgi:MraZ protein